VRFAPLFGARYFDDSGRPGLASEQWRRLFTWQKSLVDFYGHDNIRTFAAGAGQEFSASHAFQAGKVAMMLDGEWRTLAIAEENPALAYGTAPLPVDEAHPELYGASQVGMGLLVIPRGAKNPDLAFGLARYLAVDTEPLIAMANGLHNIPTTKAALASPELQGGDNFGPFLTAAGHPLSSVPPIVVQGSYFEPISGFAERWQSGAVTDLDAGLAEVDKQISAILSQD
jgi:multiple sugar transport system substrate-binding protein